MTGFTFGMILTAVSFLLYAVSGIIELTILRHDYSQQLRAIHYAELSTRVAFGVCTAGAALAASVLANAESFSAKLNVVFFAFIVGLALCLLNVGLMAAKRHLMAHNPQL